MTYNRAFIPKLYRPLMHSQDSQNNRASVGEPVGKPVLTQTPSGWTIHMADAEGKNVLNVAVFPSKFLAEEALARILKRQAGQ